MDNDTQGKQLLGSSAYAHGFGAAVAPDRHNLAPNTSPPIELGCSPRRSVVSYPLHEDWWVPSIVHPPTYTAFSLQQQPDYVTYGGKPDLNPVYTLQFDCDRTAEVQTRAIPCLLSDGFYSNTDVGNASFPINTGLSVFTLAPGRETAAAPRLSGGWDHYDGLPTSGSDEQGSAHLPHAASGPDCQRRAFSPLPTTHLRRGEEAPHHDEFGTSGQFSGLLPATRSTSVPGSSGGMHYCHHPICGKRFRRKEHLVRHRHMWALGRCCYLKSSPADGECRCHSREPKRFLCEFCGLDQFNRSDNRDAHRKRHAQHPRAGRRGVAFVPEAVPIIEEEERRRRGASWSRWAGQANLGHGATVDGI